MLFQPLRLVAWTVLDTINIEKIWYSIGLFTPTRDVYIYDTMFIYVHPDAMSLINK
jgi:hypothetical protein